MRVFIEAVRGVLEAVKAPVKCVRRLVQVHVRREILEAYEKDVREHL